MSVIDQVVTPKFSAYHGDTVDVARGLPDNSIHFSVFSPPFESLYTYSASPRDMGNSRDSDEFWRQYRFLIAESFRVMMPGRIIAIHCMDLPTSKTMHGYIGMRDFPGEIVRSYSEAGFIYHSRICIWKDPVQSMQRTKALGLLHKTIRKDSSMSRQGIADTVIVMRKPGENPERIGHTNEDFPVSMWQRYASPVWALADEVDDDRFRILKPDINPGDTLQYRSAREDDDEKHICPLQLPVIRRCVKLWSNPGDVVWSQFMGIGSEGVVALEEGRKFIGAELKESYFKQAIANLHEASAESKRQADLFL